MWQAFFFTAKAALRGERTLAELAQQFDVHANQITAWKAQLRETLLFGLAARRRHRIHPARSLRGDDAVRQGFRALVGCALIAGCTAPPPPDPDAGLEKEKAMIADIGQQLADSIKRLHSQADAGVLPRDYKKQVDTKLANSLIDPDSRKLEFVSHPYGGLVCGLINAKNRMGGYTGKEPFFAVFNSQGSLVDAHAYTWDEFAPSRTQDLGPVSDCKFEPG